MLAMLYIELAIIIALILINGLLALAELAIVSSRRARLQALVDRDVIGSRRALALASDPGRFLSTVQIGITLVGVLSGAFSGATLGLRLAEGIAELGLPTGVAEAVGVGLVVAVITYFSLLIGELVPKQIALRDPEKIAVRVAPAMMAIARIASPIVSFLDISGRAVLRALGYQGQADHRVTDEEIRTLMAEAETAGVIEPSERAMIAGVMRLGDRPVRAVMTPRREVDMIGLTADPEDIRRTIVESVHSRLPVHAGTPEEMLGVVQAKDLLNAYLRGEPRTYGRTCERLPMFRIPPMRSTCWMSSRGRPSIWHSSTTSTVTSKELSRTPTSWKRSSVSSERMKAWLNPMPCSATMDHGSSLAACLSTRWLTGCPSPSRRSATITRLRASLSISSVTCRPLAKALIIKGGVSKSSISMAVALTRFWLDALALGGGEQRFNAESRSSKSDGTSAGIRYGNATTFW